MVALPLAYFERRSVSHILSRIRSASAIHSAIATGVVESFMDAVMAIAILVMMFMISPLLAWIGIGSLAVYFLLVYLFSSGMARANIDQVAATARQEADLLEILRSTLSIKLGVSQARRVSRWKNRQVEQLESNLRIARFSVFRGASSQALLGVESLISIGVGASLVIESKLTVGVLMAFMAYRAQFSGRVTNLVDKYIVVKSLRAHYDRVRDIIEHKTEAPTLACQMPMAEQPRLEVRDLAYTFDGAPKPVFRGVNLAFGPGEVVAIYGRSGCGKSTFLKILMGLLPPTQGEVLADGSRTAPMRDYLLAYRMGAVLQGDTLATGSLADNISWFTEAKDLEAIEKAARGAQVDQDIRSMPMGYFTLVGELGNSLSAGQYQRVLLARLIYRNQRIAILDEATSNLDAKTEAAIIGELRARGMTVIWVTHREHSRALADRAIEFLPQLDGTFTAIERPHVAKPPEAGSAQQSA